MVLATTRWMDVTYAYDVLERLIMKSLVALVVESDQYNRYLESIGD